MKTRTLGAHGPQVSALGLGCMGMSGPYATRDDAQAQATIFRALDLGITFFDTSDFFGPHANERLLGQALRGQRNAAFIATKFGMLHDPDDAQVRGVSGRPEYVRRAVDASLTRLRADHIDLYYQQRPDPATPVEETMGALADLVKAGKIRFIGLCDVSPDTLSRAHATHPVSAVQSEYSLLSREPEQGILTKCRELGIGFVPGSPLGRGLLTATLNGLDDLAADDYRRHHPHFQGQNFTRNLRLTGKLAAMAQAHGVSAAQFALAWVLAQGDDVVPLSGTRRQACLSENAGALAVTLSEQERAELDEVFAPAAGAR